MAKISHKKQSKYLTIPVFERHMAALANSFHSADERFSSIDQRFDRVEMGIAGILGEIQAMRAESREDRQSVAALAYNDIHHERSIDDLQGRVARLEAKRA